MPSTNNKQEATSNISNSTNETLKSASNSRPTCNEELTGTPFRIVHLPEHGWFITLGMNRVTTGVYKTREEAIKPIQDRDWNTLCNVIVTLIEQVQEIKQTQNSNK